MSKDELGRLLANTNSGAGGYEGEKGYHGTPSGIDNTAATYGGVLRFQRTDAEPLFVTKKLKTPIRIVYASTGITASTSKVALLTWLSPPPPIAPIAPPSAALAAVASAAAESCSLRTVPMSSSSARMSHGRSKPTRQCLTAAVSRPVG